MGQPGGPGSDGPVPSPGGQQVEELMCRTMLVTQNVVYPSQTARGVDGADLMMLHGVCTSLWRSRCPALVQLENPTKNP